MEKVIVLSASANKLANLKKQAAEYAALIMEELDPDHHGYIEVKALFELFSSCCSPPWCAGITKFLPKFLL